MRIATEVFALGLVVFAAACVVPEDVVTSEVDCPTCQPDGGGGGGGGTTGGGTGGGNATPIQLCRAAARDTCANLGYPVTSPGGGYCYMVFAQDCSQVDRDYAYSFCIANPTIPRDTRNGDCRLLWL